MRQKYKTLYRMRKKIWLMALPLLCLHATSYAQDTTTPQKPRSVFGQILDAVTKPASGGALSNADIASGLREALRVGINKGADQASATDGYYKNPLIKILFPPELQRVETRLRQVGLGPQVDRFVMSLNRAAEDAAQKSKPIFVKAIMSMTIQDAIGILRGPQDAATQYLRRTSGQELVKAFTPDIDAALKKNNTTKYYSDLVNAYNRIPLVQKVNPNLTEYATNKAVDGLFILVAQEEKNIRENPAARVSEILRRVFGS